MAMPPLGYKRLILALPPGASSVDLRVAAEFARLLQLEMVAIMLDDFGLADPGRLPFTREFRGPLSGWQPIDAERIRRDLETAAQNLQRSIEAATRDLETNARFEVVRGSLGETLRAMADGGDILVLAEPSNPAERASAQFNWLTEAVLGSQTAVLLVPARIARTGGPVVAIAAAADDPSIHAAADIAIACTDELVIIDADHIEHGSAVRDLGGDERLRVTRMAAARGNFPDPALLSHAFRHLQERLVVMTRGSFDDSVASTIASARHVPVLLIAPPPPEAQGETGPDEHIRR